MTPPVEMTKGRAALPATVVAEQDPFFIALGRPEAQNSCRDDNSFALSMLHNFVIPAERSAGEGPAVPST